jgi:branched-chain amino acid transport system permease protein
MPRQAVLSAKLAILGAIVLLIAIIPKIASEFRVGQFTFVALYFIALAGLNVLTGYSGQISLGHGAFMGVGAYVAAILTLGRPGLELLGTHPPGWLPIGNGMASTYTIPVAFVVAGIVGYAFGIPALRLAGVSLALATFAVAVSLPAVAKRFENVTGGGGGLSMNLPTTPFGLKISTPHWLYYQGWVAAGILALVAWLLLRGRAGRSLAALRDGEAAAVSAGISPALYKTFAFGLSSAYAGVAGALLAIQVAYVNPDTFPVSLSILLLASLVLGGLGSLYGALLGALIMEFLPIYAHSPPLLSADLSKQSPAVVFGVFLIVVMFLAPSGLMGLLRRLTRPMIVRHNPKQHVSGAPDAPDH